MNAAIAIVTAQFLTIASVAVANSDLALAAGNVYVPERVKVTAQIHSNRPLANPYNFTPKGPPQHIEAWYFKDSCVVAKTYQLDSTQSLEKWVYAYSYDGKSRNGKPAFQQWGSPRAQQLLIDEHGRLPSQAAHDNPLWYMIDFKKRLLSDGENGKVLPLANGQRVVQLYNEPVKSTSHVETLENKFLVEDDRILSISLIINSTYHKQEAAPKSLPTADPARVVYRHDPSDFDLDYPNIPRKITTWFRGPGSMLRDVIINIQSVTDIPSEIGPTEIIDKATKGLRPIVFGTDGQEVIKTPDSYTVQSLEGESLKIRDLIADKTALILLWSSLELAEQNTNPDVPHYDSLAQLKTIFKKYGDDPDVVIFGLSIDNDAATAKAFAQAHNFAWQNYLLPVKMHRAALQTFSDGIELPSAIVINRRGQKRYVGMEKSLGRNYLEGPPEGTQPWIPFVDVVEEDRAAQKAGGYAKHWLGPEVLDVLANFDNVEVCELTGDHMSELMAAANMPLPPPLPKSGHLLAADPGPTTKIHNMPTSVSVLGNYPVKRKAVLSDINYAREIARLFMDDKAVESRFGEENFPAYSKGIIFKSGADVVGLVGDGPDVEIYLNNERATWIWLSDDATRTLQNFFASNEAIRF